MMLASEDLTDDMIRELRADLTAEWKARCVTTTVSSSDLGRFGMTRVPQCPEARELLAIIVSALNPMCHSPRREEARRRIAAAINARSKAGGRG